MRPQNQFEGRTIIVCTYKYDGTEHRRWPAQVSRIEDSLLVLDARFEEEIRHPLLGIIHAGTVSLEYYWLDRWFSIFHFQQPTGETLNFYCNINTPPRLQDDLLSYTDLDIDILVAPDLSYTILDEDEFQAHAIRFNYPLEVKRQVHLALNEMIALIESKQFPFHDIK